MDNTQEFRKLIEESGSILICSHQGPDPDAVSSTIFTYNILKKNFPDKKVYANITLAELGYLSRICNVEDISTLRFFEALDTYKPDLLIVVDLGEYKLLDSEFEDSKLKLYREDGLKIVQIDHHPIVEIDRDILFNYLHSSCAETVYEVFIRQMKLDKYEDYPNHILLGIISDTGYYAWIENEVEHAFDTSKQMVLEGGRIDSIWRELDTKTMEMVKIHGEYINNIETNGEYSYSFITDDFFLSNPDISDYSYTNANKQFISNYLKKIETATWCFTVKAKGDNKYSISFRSLIDAINLNIFAKKLGGGGHKTSAGGLITASNVKEAVDIIIKTIEENKEEAYATK